MRIPEIKLGYGFNELSVIAKALFSFALVVAITLLVLVKLRDNPSITVNSEAYNALNDLITEVINLAGWVGLFVVVVLGIVLYGYSRAMGGGKK